MVLGLAPIGLALEAGESTGFGVAFAFSYADALALARPTSTDAVRSETGAKAKAWVEKITSSSGSLAASAACSALVYAIRGHGGGAASAAAVLVGEAVRVVNAVGVATVTATAAGRARVDANGAGEAQVLVTGRAAPSCRFFGSGEAEAEATSTARIFRRYRMRFQPPARAIARLEGAAWTFVLAQGRNALATALVTGTTYKVGRSIAVGEAAAMAEVRRWLVEKPAAVGVVAAVAEPSARARGYGQAVAVALLSGDAAVIREGVCHFEVFGLGRASASGRLKNVAVFQPIRVNAMASAQAAATQARGVGAQAWATAKATGEGSIVQTATEAVAVGTRASAIAAATHTRTLRGAPAMAMATARGDALQRPTGAVGAAVADARGESAAVRSRFAAGAAAAPANVSGVGAWNTSSRGAATGSSTVAPAQVVLLISGDVQCQASGAARPTRVRYPVAVASTARCTATGFNQVNDLSRAPLERTVRVQADIRELDVPHETRQMAA